MIVHGKLCSQKTLKYNEIDLALLPDEVWNAVSKNNANFKAVKEEKPHRFHENRMGPMDKRAMRLYRQKAFTANANMNQIADDPNAMLSASGRKKNEELMAGLVAEFDDYSSRVYRLRKVFEKSIGV